MWGMGLVPCAEVGRLADFSEGGFMGVRVQGAERYLNKNEAAVVWMQVSGN